MEYWINFPKAFLSGRVYINEKFRERLEKKFDRDMDGSFEVGSILDLFEIMRGK